MREEQRLHPTTRRPVHHPAQRERGPEHREVDLGEASDRASNRGVKRQQR